MNVRVLTTVISTDKTTPPLEALKLLVSDAATVDLMARNSSKEEKAVMVNDVARAFFEAPTSMEVAVDLLVEEGGQEVKWLVFFRNPFKGQRTLQRISKGKSRSS